MPQSDRSEGTPSISDRQVIDALPRAVVVTDADGAILLWNDEAEALYGWPETEVLGRSVIDVLSPAVDRTANSADFDMVRSGHRAASDRTVIRRDGQPV